VIWQKALRDRWKKKKGRLWIARCNREILSLLLSFDRSYFDL